MTAFSKNNRDKHYRTPKTFTSVAYGFTLIFLTFYSNLSEQHIKKYKKF
jgi:hypothetical protein